MRTLADSMGTRLRQRLFSDARVKLAALGLAAAIWSTSFLCTEMTVLTVSVPVQFVSGPSGTDIPTDFRTSQRVRS